MRAGCAVVWTATIVSGLARVAAADSPIDRILSRAQRVLWIGAHPDDENACGGLLARARTLAGTLYMATLTRGENSDILWGGLHRGSEIGAARAALFAQSAQRFGAAGIDIGPFVNGPHSLEWLDAHPDAPHQGWPATARSSDVIAKWRTEADPVGWIVGVLRARRPDVIIAMDGWCGVSGHVEHRATARLLARAIAAAADPAAYPEEGAAWRVRWMISSAHVSQPVVDCGYCKCEGPPPRAPAIDLLALEHSDYYGVTYLRAALRVAKHYENVMLERGWTDAQIEAICEAAEQAAQEAYRNGSRAYPIVEPYRLQRLDMRKREHVTTRPARP